MYMIKFNRVFSVTESCPSKGQDKLSSSDITGSVLMTKFSTRTTSFVVLITFNKDITYGSSIRGTLYKIFASKRNLGVWRTSSSIIKQNLCTDLQHLTMFHLAFLLKLHLTIVSAVIFPQPTATICILNFIGHCQSCKVFFLCVYHQHVFEGCSVDKRKG